MSTFRQADANHYWSGLEIVATKEDEDQVAGSPIKEGDILFRVGLDHRGWLHMENVDTQWQLPPETVSGFVAAIRSLFPA